MRSGRLIVIVWALVVLLVHAGRERLRQVPPQETSLPRRLRATLEGLGPTFVKFGQALSLRRDLLPESYLVALRGLQDHATPFPAEEAKREIERGLGRKTTDLFTEFEATPMAAASIAQVHRARLQDGRAVIVKVRRPAIRAQIDRDIARSPR